MESSGIESTKGFIAITLQNDRLQPPASWKKGASNVSSWSAENAVLQNSKKWGVLTRPGQKRRVVRIRVTMLLLFCWLVSWWPIMNRQVLAQRWILCACVCVSACVGVSVCVCVCVCVCCEASRLKRGCFDRSIVLSRWSYKRKWKDWLDVSTRPCRRP